MMVIQHEETILVVDAGLMFPYDYMPGVDLVIPDFEYLRANRKSLKAIVLTHGHEDHIGADAVLSAGVSCSRFWYGLYAGHP